MIREIAPLHDWHRHHPLAKKIAADILQYPDLLNLRTRCLQKDIHARYGVGHCTARTAVAIARKANQTGSTKWTHSFEPA